MAKSLVWLFDMDGVIVDNLRFENAVTEHIVAELADHRHLDRPAASKLWQATLSAHRNHARWHDYGFHCDALGLHDTWREAHFTCSNLLRKCPSSEEAISIAAQSGMVWIVSDASDWVVRFKLKSLEFDLLLFSKIFTIDNCGTNKGNTNYWHIVHNYAKDRGFIPRVYIDNRDDRLLTAHAVMPHLFPIYVDAIDHPISMGFGSRLLEQSFVKCSHEELPTVIKSLSMELR